MELVALLMRFRFKWRKTFPLTSERRVSSFFNLWHEKITKQKSPRSTSAYGINVIKYFFTYKRFSLG